MPWRIKEGVDVLEYEISPPQMVVDVEHNKGRNVFVRYVNTDGEQVDIAVEHIDDNNVRVSAVNFLSGTLFII